MKSCLTSSSLVSASFANKCDLYIILSWFTSVPNPYANVYPFPTLWRCFYSLLPFLAQCKLGWWLGGGGGESRYSDCKLSPTLPIHPEICQKTGRLWRGLCVSETSLTVVIIFCCLIQSYGTDIWKWMQIRRCCSLLKDGDDKARYRMVWSRWKQIR